jgi:hypothetical protein
VFVSVGQAAAQRVQHVPQVGPGLRFGRLGPQLGGEPLSGDRDVPVHQQVAEQGLGAGRRQWGQGEPTGPQLDGAEQPNLQERRHPSSLIPNGQTRHPPR